MANTGGVPQNHPFIGKPICRVDRTLPYEDREVQKLFTRCKWCCDDLKGAFEDRNRRGIYVVAELPHPRLNVGVTFWLGMRSIDVGDSIELNESSKPTPVLIETRRRIIFCPWCGCHIEKYYSKTYERL